MACTSTGGIFQVMWIQHAFSSLDRYMTGTWHGCDICISMIHLTSNIISPITNICSFHELVSLFWHLFIELALCLSWYSTLPFQSIWQAPWPSVAEVWFSPVLQPFLENQEPNWWSLARNRTGTGTEPLRTSSACSVLVLEPVRTGEPWKNHKKIAKNNFTWHI